MESTKESMMKVCRSCGEEKPYSEYSLKRAQRDGHQPYCKPCNRARAKEWREEHLPEEMQRDWVAAIYRHGLTMRQYTDMMDRQGGACAICRAPFENTANRRPNIDHDHRCCPETHSCGSCVRGLLCTRCNVSLHPAEADPQWLLQAARYLGVESLILLSPNSPASRFIAF